MQKYQLGSGLVSGQERVILYSQERYLDLSTALNDSTLQRELALADEQIDIPRSLMTMVGAWPYWRERLPQAVEYMFAHPSSSGLLGQLDREAIRWLPPLMYPNKLICLGANYTDHNTEMGNTTRLKYPYSFFKPPTTTLVGSGQTVKLPEYAKMIDWEVELAVVIGTTAHLLRDEEVMSCIAGYSILNDISVRDWVAEKDQSFMGLDWVMLKGFDGSAPMGPFITPAEFVSDPQQLTLSLTVNGQTKQHANTAQMVFTVREIVAHLARVMTLEPGDVIATGTPSGVGYGRKPPEFLKSGDVMVAEIEGLGSLETPVQ